MTKPSSSWLEREWYCEIIGCFCVHSSCLCYNMCGMVIMWWIACKDFRVTMSSSWHVYLCRVWRFSLRVRSCSALVCALAPCVCAETVDTRESNDGLHFHGCIGKNHLLYLQWVCNCNRQSDLMHTMSTDLVSFHNCFVLKRR